MFKPSYETIWKMTQDDVNQVTTDKLWNSFALQVNGSNNLMTWLQRDPEQVINISLIEDYGVFLSVNTDLSDGFIPKISARYNVDLGAAYLWTGSDLVSDKSATCAAGSVRLTNGSSKSWTIGLTKLDTDSNLLQPICCDVLPHEESVIYDPQLTIFAKVGRDYRAASVIGDTGDWAELPIRSVGLNFDFDGNLSKWVHE